MKRIIKVLFVIILLDFIFTERALAVILDVSNIPATISASPFLVTVSVFGANVGKNYLRVDLFKDGTINYFGETYNGGEWYTGSTGTSYFPIDIISSNATATADVQAQIGAPSNTDYLGSGQYKLRVRRYTSATSYSAGNPYDLYIDLPTPTPTETPQPTSTPTPTPTKTPTPVPTPTRTPTPTPTKTLTPSPQTMEESSSDSGDISDVLGVQNELMTSEPTPGTESGKTSSKFPLVAGGLIILGLGFIGFSVFNIIRSSKKGYTIESEKEDNQIS